MYISKYRSGIASRNSSAKVELETSPSSATTSPRACPSAASASPYAFASRPCRRARSAAARARRRDSISCGDAGLRASRLVFRLRTPPSVAITSSEWSSGLPWKPFLSSTAGSPLPLIVLATITTGLAGDVGRLGVGAVDRLDVMAVDLDRVAAEGARAVGVRVEIPAVHRLAALAEPVDVDDRDEVVEFEVRRVLERLPQSPPRSRCRRTASRPGTGAGRGACRRAPSRPRTAVPGRAIRSRRRPTGSAASGGPRRSSRTGGTSGAARR